MPRLEITIKVASTWPSPEEMEARNAVEDAFMEADLGEFVGSGGGGGQMDLCFDVEDEAAARALIAQAMKMHMPAAKYRIEIVE